MAPATTLAAFWVFLTAWDHFLRLNKWQKTTPITDLYQTLLCLIQQRLPREGGGGGGKESIHILTANFHATKCGRLLHWFAAFCKGGGSRPPRHGSSPSSSRSLQVRLFPLPPPPPLSLLMLLRVVSSRQVQKGSVGLLRPPARPAPHP